MFFYVFAYKQTAQYRTYTDNNKKKKNKQGQGCRHTTNECKYCHGRRATRLNKNFTSNRVGFWHNTQYNFSAQVKKN